MMCCWELGVLRWINIKMDKNGTTCPRCSSTSRYCTMYRQYTVRTVQRSWDDEDGWWSMWDVRCEALSRTQWLFVSWGRSSQLFRVKNHPKHWIQFCKFTLSQSKMFVWMWEMSFVWFIYPQFCTCFSSCPTAMRLSNTSAFFDALGYFADTTAPGCRNFLYTEILAPTPWGSHLVLGMMFVWWWENSRNWNNFKKSYLAIYRFK